MLAEDQIKERIKKYCLLQNGSDLRDANNLKNRIFGLLEALGVKDTFYGGEFIVNLDKEVLESVGIKVLQENPEWGFG